jgi:hypothetical protein
MDWYSDDPLNIFTIISTYPRESIIALPFSKTNRSCSTERSFDAFVIFLIVSSDLKDILST